MTQHRQEGDTNLTIEYVAEAYLPGWVAYRRLPSGIVETVTTGTKATPGEVVQVLMKMIDAGMLPRSTNWKVVAGNV